MGHPVLCLGPGSERGNRVSQAANAAHWLDFSVGLAADDPGSKGEQSEMLQRRALRGPSRARLPGGRCQIGGWGGGC